MAKTVKPNSRKNEVVWAPVEIEKGFDIPTPQCGQRKEAFPFEKLKVGESFFLGPGYEHRFNSARTSMSRINTLTDKRFTARAVDDGVRFWRVR